MPQDKLWTITEVAEELGITEEEVNTLVEEGHLSAYKIGGVYLRFKPEHVYEVKRRTPKLLKTKAGLPERLGDFFYFNDFYILASLIIILMLVIIFIT